MLKLFAFASILLSQVALAESPEKDCDITVASEAVAKCHKEVRPWMAKHYAYASVGTGDGIQPIRMDDKAYGAGVLASYNAGWVSAHGQFEWNNEQKTEVRYLFVDVGTGNYGVRVGRVQHLLGFYNQKRNVPCCADFIEPPSAIYREPFRYLATSGDGVQLYATTDIANWEIRGQLTEAKPNFYLMDDVVKGHVNNPKLGKFSDKSWVHGLNVSVVSPSRSVQFRYDRTALDFDFESNMKPFVPSGTLDTVVHTLGARWYIVDSVDVTAEYIKVAQRGDVWKAVFSGSAHERGAGGYVLSARYRPTIDWDLSYAYSNWCIELNDCDGTKTQAAAALRGMNFPAHGAYRRDHSLFARKKFQDGWFVAGQYTVGKGTEAHFVSDTTAKPKWSSFVLSVGRSW